MRILGKWLYTTLLLGLASNGAYARPPLPPITIPTSKMVYVKLSNDENVRKQQFAELAAQISAVKAARAVINAKGKSDGSQSPDFYDCSGEECFFEPPSYTFELDIGYDTAVVERVVVQGWCKITINNVEVYCSDAQANLERVFPDLIPLQNAERKTGKALSEIAEILKDYAPSISPLRDTCAKVPPTNAVQNPDQDYLLNWAIAKSSILGGYAGNFGDLRFGSRIDVLYPNNAVRRFTVTSLGVSRIGNELEIDVVNTTNPSLNDSKCKPQ